MAKVKGATRVPKVKKHGTSVRSRAARRAASPTAKLDLDPSFDQKTTEQPAFPKVQQVLRQHDGGIAKRKKQKPLSRQQRLRREKDMERAETVMDQKETAVEKSKSRGRKVEGRRAAWDDLNGQMPSSAVTKAKKKSSTAGLLHKQDEDHTVMDHEEATSEGDDNMPDPSAAFVGFGNALSSKPAPEPEGEEIL